MAFEHAYRMLKTGVVDGVVVAGCSLLLNPVLSVMMQKMNSVSPDGKSRPFDASGKYQRLSLWFSNVYVRIV